MKVLDEEIQDVELLSREELRAFALRYGCLEHEETEDIEELLAGARMAAVVRLSNASLRGIICLGGGVASVEDGTSTPRPKLVRLAVEAIAKLREAEHRRRPTSSRLNESVDGERFDVSFFDAKLGFGVSLVRGRGGVFSTRVTRVREDLLARSDLRVGDALVEINGARFDPRVDDASSFVTRVVNRVLYAPRPMRLTFAAGDGRKLEERETRNLTRAARTLSRGISLPMLRTPTLRKKRKTNIAETLRICVFRGEGLVAKDRNLLGNKTASDPYAVVHVNGTRVGQTKYVSHTLSPEWNDYFEAVVDISKSVSVRLELFDRDIGNADDAMGEVVVDARREVSTAARQSAESSSYTKWYNVRTTKNCKNATGRVLLGLFIRQRPPPMPAGDAREIDARWAVRVHAARSLAGGGEWTIDPFCIVETDGEGGKGTEKFGVFTEIGRTPVLRRTSEPEWDPAYACEFDAPINRATRSNNNSNNSSHQTTTTTTTTGKRSILQSMTRGRRPHGMSGLADVGGSVLEAGPHARVRVYDSRCFLASHDAIGQVTFSLPNLMSRFPSTSDFTGTKNPWTVPEWLELIPLEGGRRAHRRGAILASHPLVSVALLEPRGCPLSVMCISMNCGNSPIEPLDALVPANGSLNAVAEPVLSKELSSTKLVGVENDAGSERVGVFDNSRSADIVSIALQESSTSIIPGRTAAAVGSDESQDSNNNNNDGKNSGDLKKMFGVLLPNHEMVCDAVRGQMRLFVFVRAPLAGGCTEKRIAYENTGLGHVVANKGGIAFTMRLAGASHVSLVFYGAHLAAHEGDSFRLRRNSDVCEIVRGCRSDFKSNSQKGHRAPISDAVDVDSQVDFSFFSGDLNYRLGDEDEDEEETKTPSSESPAAAAADFSRDELSQEMQNGRVFCGGWVAPTPTFAPTFKVLRGQSRCLYNKKRVPSWCDRVLFKARDATPLRSVDSVQRHELVSFDSVPAVISSDHKPVRALWLLYPAPVRPLSQVETWSLSEVCLTIDNKVVPPPPPPPLQDDSNDRSDQPHLTSWSTCLKMDVHLEDGDGSRGTLHLIAVDLRWGEKVLGAADVALVRVRDAIAMYGQFDFVNLPLVRDSIITGNIMGRITSSPK
ncbi:hypothetical protein CTAYLR_002266 [Chrysophaeum taylorii]|uniref:C2 domain-containing protein n=1 Tax=Chrysophaeum taylorii TaxID=2483200 RepID=A0AAD7XN51_9STRA|nr:hypothetical protein CTAYLR_002266 [Chrysophaeum taylorii]